MTRCRECRKVNLFESRRRDDNKDSHCSFKKERRSWTLHRRKKKETMLIDHEFYVNVDVILAIIRLKFKMFKEFAKHHEFIKRILKKKVKKKKKLFISKILRSNKWKEVTIKKKNDIQDHVMTKISSKNIRKAKKIRKKWKSVRVSFLTKKKLRLSKKSRR
jgi:hypothetical protein